jgi:hypothetical protein
MTPNEISHYESLKKQDTANRKLIKKLQLDKQALKEQLILSGVVKSLPSKDTEFIYSLLPEWTKEAPKGLDTTMYGTLTYEGDREIVDKLKEILN